MLFKHSRTGKIIACSFSLLLVVVIWWANFQRVKAPDLTLSPEQELLRLYDMRYGFTDCKNGSHRIPAPIFG